MSEAAVLTEVADGVMTITINRPKAKNAVNKDVAEGIAAALDALDADDSTHVVILTGAGGTFCSGMDLKAFVTGETPYVEGRGFAGMVQRSTDKPLIAAVEGYALAGGCELAITCDLIIAADNSKFGIPEVKRGLAAAAGGLVRLPRRIPSRVAMEMALTGDFMDADRALSIALLNQIAPAGAGPAHAKGEDAQVAVNGTLRA